MNRRFLRAIFAMAPSAILLLAYSTGPEPRHTAAPGDDPLACTTAGCHTGTALNGGGGSVTVDFPDGTSYTPGATKTFNITISDPKGRVYGFQMSARLDSNPSNGQAGDFTSGIQQIVICDDSNLKGPLGCPANNPVQFIEHSRPFTANTISVQWKAPATNVGNIHIYVAGNAANNDGNDTGDHIYTASYLLTPAGPPTITSLNSAADFSATAGLASGTWLEIYGSNLSDSTRLWAGSDFDGIKAPTSLENVTVTINGIQAFIDYVSPTQVNVQAPADTAVGDAIPIVLTNKSGKSTITMAKKQIAPAVLAPASFNVGGKQYVVAQFSDQTFVGKTGLIAGLPFRPAAAGDVITIYAIGCGPVSQNVLPGEIAQGVTTLLSPLNFKFNGVAGTLSYAGLAPGQVGLYQFNVKVPTGVSGDVPLQIDASGAPIGQTLFITVQ